MGVSLNQKQDRKTGKIRIGGLERNQGYAQ